MSNSSLGLGDHTGEVGEPSNPDLPYPQAEEYSDEDHPAASPNTENGLLLPDQSQNR